ncbi:response regulator transcription factor [Streptomyces sp. CNQ085]|uniref:response regulator transcription factor n=1 Tax=Streptomyces sp. CNQ085 TaxID=2886944 RepID=UPI001F512B55|nr:response regulator transcription factor [Streptomyces sp. CNQ085]MCI0383768.1 response regulator transcription factor [Streptomyces sp. CNQ085]
MASVLLVEDDPVIRARLIDVLSRHDHVVRSSPYGFEALREVTRQPPDAVVLDLGLPDLDGVDVLRMLRSISQVPVLVATARDDEAEIIRLLNAGADDYLVKPFSGGQLAARLGAVLRRSATAERAPAPAAARREGAIRVGGLAVDRQARSVFLDGSELRLTRREFDLLAYLAERADRVVPRRRLLADVWRQPYVEEQTLDVHVSSLRRKLGERASRPRYLHTVRGVGIKLVTPR